MLDLGKAAKLLSDIAAVGQEADLSGVDVVTADDEMLDSYRQEVRTHAQVYAYDAGQVLGLHL